ncbi:MAG TPA: cation diffusion facilitator family transporter [Oligoflexia bacterium]|nr:cation diffusion facilitator family transporter [bacterium]HMQ11358.1 cation diffusion facilitator family transporter [Oligoflexia bacterium]HMR24076.1 cation diffusion facilitator family transporter [Oligoflexia bacterium]
MSDCGCEIEIKDQEQRGVLYWLLGINLTMFFFEIGVGWFAQSTALIADALDMFADAIVYSIALYAVGRSSQHKTKAALFSGYFQSLLGFMVIVDIVRRIAFGSEPESLFMMGMGAIALVANVVCLLLIKKHKDGEVHMRASWIFSANDVIANIGVILGGILVWKLGVRWPDLAIGLIIATIILRGARHIIKDAKNS